MKHILALDQGTSSSRAIVFDATGASPRHRPAGIPPVLPAARLGRARSGRSGRPSSTAPRGPGQSRHHRPRCRRHRHRQPARNHRAVGARHRPPRWRRPSSGRTAAPLPRLRAQTARRRPRAADSRPQRPGARPLFLGHQAGLAARHVPDARARAEAANWPSAPSTAGWSGSSPAARRMSPMPATPPAPALRHPPPVLERRIAGLFDIPAPCCRRSWTAAACWARPPELFGAPIPIGGWPATSRPPPSARPAWPGMAKNTYGTGCFLMINTGEQARAPPHRLLTTVGWRIGARTDYMLEGSVFIGGAVVQWLRDGLGLIEQAADIEALAASCRTAAARCCSCRPSPASARPTGTATPAAPWSA
jgi:glycerol kinase